MSNLSTYEKILQSAENEFLEKGFEKASIRAIAKNVNISSAALYRHFESKEHILASILQPMITHLEEMYQEKNQYYLDPLDNGTHLHMWDQSVTDLDLILDHVYTNFDRWKILLCKCKGTRYENYFQSMVDNITKSTAEYLDLMRERGHYANQVDPVELNLIMSSYYSAIIQMVHQDFTREQAAHYIKTLKSFFYPGWQNLLGF